MLDSSVVVAAGGLALLLVLACLALLAALLRTRARARRDVESARAETAALREQIEAIERVLAAPTRSTPRVQPEYTITGLGGPESDEATGRTGSGASVGPAVGVDRALFADLVLRETVVRAASLAHGVRRALAPETRNRVRFEVRREIKRARKQRRADTREARREWEARQRATVDAPAPEQGAPDNGTETAA